MIIRLRSIARNAVDISRVYVPRGVSHAHTSMNTPLLISAVDADMLERSCGRTQQRTRRIPPCKPRYSMLHACIIGATATAPTGVEEKRLHDPSAGWMSGSSMISPSTPASSSSAAGSSSCAVDFSRSFGGFPTEAGGPPYSSIPTTAALSMDPSWSNFLQQVGF